MLFYNNHDNELKASVCKKLLKISNLQKHQRNNCVVDSGVQTIQTFEPNFHDHENPITDHNASFAATTALMEEYERKRAEDVSIKMKERFAKFSEFSKKLNEGKQQQWIQHQQDFIQTVQQQERNIIELLELNNTNFTGNKYLIQNFENLEHRKAQIQKHFEESREKNRVLCENVKNLKNTQQEFIVIYREIIDIINKCANDDNKKIALTDSYNQLKNLSAVIEKLTIKSKTLDIDQTDVIQAEEVLSEVKNLKKKIEEIIQRITQSQQHSPSDKNIKKGKEENDFSADTSVWIKYISEINVKQYNEIIEFYSNFSQNLKQFNEDKTLKSFKADLHMAINIPVNAISAVNSKHLNDKYVRLYNLLSGQAVTVGNTAVNASTHPKGILYCMDLLAKRFVLQGDLLISSNPEAAFSYATIIVTLWIDFPNFGKLLLYYFYKFCPYIVPFYIPKTDEQSMKDYYMSLGYTYINEQIEKQDKFLKRMAGIMRLYFTVLIAYPKSGKGENPYNLRIAWLWLTSILKLEPQMDITATALHVFLETVGYDMSNKYGLVFKKIMMLLCKQFIPVIKKIDSGAPVSRLESLLQEYRKNGFKKSTDCIAENFW